MLSLLHIENIALIQSADIRFEPGFNVLTGETGAGKSIVIDSIGAVLGERTSRELIRTGAKSALVTAVFTQVPPLPWLEENGFPTGEEELLLQRELQGDGRNVCRIDGKLVTVAQLRELGRQLLNIHGQHDGQQLLDPASHLGYLDQFGGCQPLLEDYQEAYRKWHDIRREMDKLQMDEAERSRRVDTLNYQIQELERAQLKAGEDEELSARRTLLRSAGKLMEAVQSAEFALSGDEDRDGACSLIAQAEGEVQGVSSISPELSELSEKLTALRCAADDAADTLRDLSRSFDFSPGELDQVEERLDLLYRLRKKYGPTVEDMLAYLDRCRKELDQIQYADDTLARLEKELRRHKRRPRAGARPVPGPAGGGRGPPGAGPGGAAPAGHAQGPVPDGVHPQGGRGRDGRDRSGRGAVPHVRQPGGGPEAHPEGGLRRRAGPDHAGPEKCAGRGGPDRHPGL